MHQNQLQDPKLHVDEAQTELVSVLPVRGNSEVEFSFVPAPASKFWCPEIVPLICKLQML